MIYDLLIIREESNRKSPYGHSHKGYLNRAELFFKTLSVHKNLIQFN